MYSTSLYEVSEEDSKLQVVEGWRFGLSATGVNGVMDCSEVESLLSDFLLLGWSDILSHSDTDIPSVPLPLSIYFRWSTAT